MNNLVSLIYNLPEDVQKKALDAGESSDNCCTVYCESIEVVEDYILQLQKKIALADSVIELANSVIEKLNSRP